MGFIDADAHVREGTHTWDFFDPAEAHFRPITVESLDAISKSGAYSPTTADGKPLGAGTQWWIVRDQRMLRNDRYLPNNPQAFRETFPEDTLDLIDLDARLRMMDRFGVDVEMIFSTFFIQAEIDNPLIEAAVARSYNRFMAEVADKSGGRIKWALKAPTGMLDRALEELEFGREHGAVGVSLHGVERGMALVDPYFWPLYERAQALDLAITVHTGIDSRERQLRPGNEFALAGMLPVINGCFAVLSSDMSERFPTLRWVFMEAGASWVPFVAMVILRTGPDSYRKLSDPAEGRDMFAWKNVYVGCLIDEDLPNILPFVGDTHILLGSDYSHMDPGSDPEAHRLLLKRDDVDQSVLQMIVDDNGRRAFGIDPAFRPTDNL